MNLVVKSHPNKPAFIFYSPRTKQWDTISFSQLADLTERFSSGLSAWHIASGMRAALMTPPSTDFLALAFAMLKQGIVPIVIDPAIGLKKVSECLKESEPDIFIGNTFTHLLRIIYGWGKNTIKHNLSIRSILHNSESSPPDIQPLLSTSPAAILYTSGSTGLPKGALYTRGNIATQLEMLKDTFDISQDEIDLPAFPLYALIDALLGVTSVIPDISFPAPKDINPARILSAIQEYKVTNTFASPVLLDKLATYGIQHNLKLPSLKRVITAGAPAPIQVQRKFGKLLSDEALLFGIYGATETLPIAIVESREIFNDAQGRTTHGAGICLGRPVKGAQVRIIEITETAIEHWRDSLLVQPNVIGEITVRGKAVTESYFGRAEATRLAKIRDGDEIVHRMGDVGYFDEQGRLWYCGRKSHRVITTDDVLFTEQIEGIFNAHPQVYRSALVGVNKEPVLWIELERDARNADQQKIKNELIDLARDHPQASKIKRFLFMKKFPTDVRHNSKIIREELTLLAEKRLA
jgi:acyl-CoA synthetase (AMP-forming)/AMP-acid ligase II